MNEVGELEMLENLAGGGGEGLDVGFEVPGGVGFAELPEVHRRGVVEEVLRLAQQELQAVSAVCHPAVGLHAPTGKDGCAGALMGLRWVLLDFFPERYRRGAQIRSFGECIDPNSRIPPSTL